MTYCGKMPKFWGVFVKAVGISLTKTAPDFLSGSISRALLAAQLVKNLPASQETQLQSLGWEDPLEEEMTTHSSTLAWRIPWTEEPGGLQSTGSHRVKHD